MIAPLSGPLQGLRVIEISSYVATPLCGLVLRQLGAEVIRVEPVEGSPDRLRLPRAADGTSLYWTGLNGGKRDLALDLTDPEARNLLSDLICGAGTGDDSTGLVVSNTERYADLNYGLLSERRDDLVHVLLTGTRDGRNAVDYTVQASSGFPAVTGPKGSAVPTNGTIPAWDIAAGLYLATGLLAAIHERGRTGRGQQVRVALEDVALATVGSLGFLAEAQLNGVGRGPQGNDVYGTFGRDFVSADGVRFMLVVLTKSHWRRLIEATCMGAAVEGIAKALDADFDDEAERYNHRAVLFSLLERWFEARDWDQIEPVLGMSRVLVSGYRTFDDLAADDAAALRAMPLFQTLEQPGAGSWQAPGSPLLFGGLAASPDPAPQVGSDNDDILTEMGLSPGRIARLRQGGSVR